MRNRVRVLGGGVKEELTATLEFIDTTFDLESELPEDSNQCRGKDVAETISAALSETGYEAEIFEEDWGWLALYKLTDGGECTSESTLGATLMTRPASGSILALAVDLS